MGALGNIGLSKGYLDSQQNADEAYDAEQRSFMREQRITESAMKLDSMSREEEQRKALSEVKNDADRVVLLRLYGRDDEANKVQASIDTTEDRNAQKLFDEHASAANSMSISDGEAFLGEKKVRPAFISKWKASRVNTDAAHDRLKKSTEAQAKAKTFMAATEKIMQKISTDPGAMNGHYASNIKYINELEALSSGNGTEEGKAMFAKAGVLREQVQKSMNKWFGNESIKNLNPLIKVMEKFNKDSEWHKKQLHTATESDIANGNLAATFRGTLQRLNNKIAGHKGYSFKWKGDGSGTVILMHENDALGDHQQLLIKQVYNRLNDMKVSEKILQAGARIRKNGKAASSVSSNQSNLAALDGRKATLLKQKLRLVEDRDAAMRKKGGASRQVIETVDEGLAYVKEKQAEVDLGINVIKRRAEAEAGDRNLNSPLGKRLKVLQKQYTSADSYGKRFKAGKELWQLLSNGKLGLFKSFENDDNTMKAYNEMVDAAKNSAETPNVEQWRTAKRDKLSEDIQESFNYVSALLGRMDRNETIEGFGTYDEISASIESVMDQLDDVGHVGGWRWMQDAEQRAREFLGDIKRALWTRNASDTFKADTKFHKDFLRLKKKLEFLSKK